MSIFEIFLLALGLSCDAFSAALCQGLGKRRVNAGFALIVGLFFGGFQALMPGIGWLLGSNFGNLTGKYGHITAFLILSFAGGKMMYEGLKAEDFAEVFAFAEAKSYFSGEPIGKGRESREKIGIGRLFFLAIATSIDALSVGIALPSLCTNLPLCLAIIGSVTFLLSFLGVFIGGVFGAKFKGKAEIFGGIILILIGAKLLAQIHFS